MALKWVIDKELGDKYVPLPNLGYITEINLYNYENELIDAGDFWPYLFRFEDDLKDPSIPCEEKKQALEILWRNIQEFLKADPDYIWIFPGDKTAPQSHWWWHPELWDKGIDPLEVLKDVCPQD